MSIMRKMKPIYRQEGGTTPGAPTLPSLPGVDAHENLNTSIAAGSGPSIAEGASPEEINKAYIEWASDPSNIPDYYGGATVAEFDPLQLEAFASKEKTAAQLDELNKQQLDYYQDILSGDSEHLQRAADTAAGTVQSGFYGAGTPGSARGQFASNLAAQEAQFGLQQDAITGISGVQDKLTQGADLLGKVGDERRQYVQDVINEDIKRWNFAHPAPQQQWDRLLGLANQLKGMELGTLVDSGGNSVPAWKNILSSVVGSAGGDSNILEQVLSFFNQGGPVYKQAGGMIPPAAPPGPGMTPPAPPMNSGPPMGMAPPAAPMAPEPAGIMGASEPMDEPGIMATDITMISDEPMSEIDRVEALLEGLVASSDGAITIKRKKKKGGK